MTLPQSLLLVSACSCLFAAAEARKQRSPLERLQEARLAAVREARLQWTRDRVVEPPLGIYNDYRAVIHVHAQDAGHTLGTREQVLAAARATGVNVVMWTGHRGPMPESWTGMRGGVLFIAGTEDADNRLRFPQPGAGLSFLSHLEDAPARSSEGFDGMEIYNRHTGARLNPEFTEYLNKTAAAGREFGRLAERQRKYPDEVFAAATGPIAQYLERWDREIQLRPFTGIAANDTHPNTVIKDVVFDPYEVSFRHVSTHILARELTEEQIRSSLRQGHVYVAHDWLCDPAGFAFAGLNNLGLFEMGDRVPLMPGTRIAARFPVAAHARIIHKGAVVYQATGREINYTPTAEGAYRLEAWLSVDGEERPWIFANPLYLYKPAADIMKLPPSTLAPNVKAVRDIVYLEGQPEDAAKHKLDLYLPSDRTDFPVLMFVHGGNWRNGDRSLYPSLGNRLARAGVGVVIPSYRLAPRNPPPAQIQDLAAAFAWTVKTIGQYGGDLKRLYVAGHSAGGHLVSLLALDPQWLANHDLNSASIRGVAALSGVYDVTFSEIFGPDRESRRRHSPIAYVSPDAPRFLITYCQWDYPGLAVQARRFDAELRKAFVESKLLYIPGENHISEILNFWKDDDRTSLALLELVGP